MNYVQRVAAKAVIESEEGILALKPSRIDKNRKWHIPGGIRDDIDEPIYQTAVREVMEETGIDISQVPGVVFRVGEWNGEDKGEQVRILAIFFHVILPTRPSIVLSEEHDDFAWLTKANHTNYDANIEVYEIIEQLLS